MTLTEQIADFSAFAMKLAQEQGEQISLDDAFHQWRAIDPKEVEILRERLAKYDAGERGRPAKETMRDLRARLHAKYGA